MTWNHLLTALLALSAGWCWGHSTARIRTVVIGATAIDDAAAVALNDACCEQWWTSAGAEHDPACPRRENRSHAA